MVLPHTYRSLMRWKSSFYCFIPAAKRYCRLDCMSDCSISFRARLFYCGKIYFPVGAIGGCKNDKSSN